MTSSAGHQCQWVPYRYEFEGLGAPATAWAPDGLVLTEVVCPGCGDHREIE